MSIECTFYGAPITFSCDDCGEVEETRCTDFGGAMAKFKSHGWVARKKGDQWEHYCKDCK